MGQYDRKVDRWKLLRTAPAAGDTTDLVGTNTDPDDASPAVVTADLPTYNGPGRGPTKQIEVVVAAVNSSGVVLDRATCTFTLSLVEAINRSDTVAPGVSIDSALCESADLAASVLQTKYRVQINGSERFTILVADVANAPATTDVFQVWYREVDA